MDFNIEFFEAFFEVFVMRRRPVHIAQIANKIWVVGPDDHPNFVGDLFT